jgi:predicted Rossmann fold nucleotide-binding protein DprA/Smf involved in DNA uptake
VTLTSDSKAVVALTTRLGGTQRPSLTAKMWHRFAAAIEDSGRQPADVFDTAFDPSSLPGIDADLAQRVSTLLVDAASATLEVDELFHKGIWTLTIADESYPATLRARLGDASPPVLFGIGVQSLLGSPGIGIVGSRDIDESAAAAAEAIAEEAVSIGRSVVSGGARGVDQIAMNAAFSAGGKVIGVIADPLIGRIRRPDILDALDKGSTCFVTVQSPSSGFTPAAAMDRNKVVYALSAVVIVISAAEQSGGTWAGAREAIRNRNGKVLVWRGSGEGPGNHALIKEGGLSISSPDSLQEHLETDAPDQLSLELRR